MKISEKSKRICRYSFGCPLSTYAVVGREVPSGDHPMDFFEAACGNDITLRYRMDSKDVIYGLGENHGGMNKRGRLYHSYCSDDALHTPDKNSLYGAHNFLLIDGQERFGVFVDFPGRVIFDAGFTHKDILEITICGTDADIYIIKGESSRSIVRHFISLVGSSYVPPKWAFGYQQSRWSYSDAEEIKSLAESFLSQDIPCDAIYLDIDYMKDFKDFTIDSSRFPDFPGFVRSIKEKGFRLVPIIDAGVKIEKGYDIYEEGIENGFFCRGKNGDPFVAAVWPGKVHFPDFLNSRARKWFGSKYKLLTECGIEGFWNDMNEPAIFYTDRGLKHAIKKAAAADGKNLDVYDFFSLRDAFNGISNNQEDYRSFFHDYDGTIIEHDKVHNLYGFFMTKAAAEGLESIAPDKRLLLFSRASSIGMHRYSGIWTGDNHSWWEHLLLNIKMMPSINMCGFLYCGADTGGFSGDVSSELLIRWMQFGIFTPLFRNHSALGTRRQEPFAFDEETTGILRDVIRLRYALMPYLYSEFMKAAIAGDMYFAPISFDYGDEVSRKVEDQLLLGESVMLCPVYEGNSRGRHVWLPEKMLLWKASQYKKREYEVVDAGHQYIEVELGQVPIFLRKDRMLVIGKHAANIDSLNQEELHVIAFVAEKAGYLMYDDDGGTLDYKKGICSEILITIEKKDIRTEIKVSVKGTVKAKKLRFDIVGMDGNMTIAVVSEKDFIRII